ncbi:MAG: hypothetical protein Q9227_000094 [Pyrenula ochraceoflavens]
MASPGSRIAELSATIGTLTSKIDSYLAEKGLPYPSFEANGPVDLQFPPDIEQSRAIVLEATQELNDLLQGPRNLLLNHQHNLLLYLKLISRFDLAKKVPLDREISYADLATATPGLNQDALTRILRLGIAHRIFREPIPGSIAHSSVSRQIADDPNMADWLGSNVDDMWPSAEKGFTLANNTTSSFYATLGSSPARARRFGGAMSFFTSGPGFSLTHLTNTFTPIYSALPSPSTSTLVDLGGSHGDAAFALSRAFPTLHRIICQELPEVIADCKPQADCGNVEFMAHDFFEEQVVRGAEVYLFRWILHNWPDRYCGKILKALVPALKKGARVLVMDFVMPPFGVLPNGVERALRSVFFEKKFFCFGANMKILREMLCCICKADGFWNVCRAMDVTMLEIANAKERDLGEWKALFEQTDSRFKFGGMNQPEGSNLALLEFIWEG